MPSETKSKILMQHQANSQLNTPLLPQSMTNNYDLSADELTYPLDEEIIAASSEALEAGQTHYVDVPGIAPLREAIAQHLNSEMNTQYKKENILITAGVQEARFLTIQKISEQYDSISVPEVVHPGVLKALGVRTRKVISLPIDLTQSALPSLETIAKAIESGSRLLYLESPSRLTGEVYTDGEVAQISEMAIQHNVAIIWDQGLAVWVADSTYCSLATLDTETTLTATIGEAMPGMGLANWFIGYIAAPQGWITPIQSQKQIMAICTSTASQYAALGASELFTETHSRQMKQLSDLKARLIQVAGEAHLDVIAGEAVNIFAIRLLPQNNTDTITKLRELGFDVADGTDFGAPHIIRLNVTGAAEEAIKKLADVNRG